MKRPGLSRAMRIILLFVIIGILLRYLFVHKDVWETLGKVKPADLFWLAFCWLFLYLGSGLRFDLLARNFGAKLKLHESVILSAACSTVSFLLPMRAGLGLRGVYLLGRHDVRIGAFAAIMLGTFALSFAVEGAAGLIVCFYLSIIGQSVSGYLYGGFLTLTLGAGFAWFFPLNQKCLKNWLKGKLATFASGRKALKQDIPRVVWVIFINVVTSLLYGTWLWFGYRSMSLPISFWGAFLMGLTTTLTLMVAITPGNLGVQEAVIGGVATLVGSSFDNGLIVSLLLRGVSMMMLMVVGLPSLWYITSEINKDRKQIF